MLRIGVRAHDFGRLPARELAQKIAARGMSCVQLAVNKAITWGGDAVNLVPGRGDLTAGLAWEIGHAFAAAGVQIAVLGCYINLSNPDAAARAPLMAFFREHLRCARDFGCGIVATETGSLNADWSFHPGNKSEQAYQALVPRVAELVEEAQRFGVAVGIEGVATHVLNSPARIRQLLDDVQSRNLQVVFDPVNLLSVENYREQDRIVKESLDLFGDRIAAVHAKDFLVQTTQDADDCFAVSEMKQVRAGAGGKGMFHYEPLIKWLAETKPGISILLEEASEYTGEECAAYLKGHLAS